MKTTPSALKQLSVLNENMTDPHGIFASPEAINADGMLAGQPHGWLTQDELEYDGPEEVVNSESAWYFMKHNLEQMLTWDNLTPDQLNQIHRMLEAEKKHNKKKFERY